MSDVAQIANALAEVQASGVRRASPLYPGAWLVPAGYGRGLAPLGLAVRTVDGMYLTPLGLQVRDHLMNEGE